MNLKNIVEGRESRAGKAFGIFIQLLIVISIVTFSIETLPDLRPDIVRFLSIAETVIVIIFTIEYILRIYVADKATQYIFSFYGIIDFIAIAPFYVALGVDLRSLRILRMLRLIRLFKMVRYNRAMQRFIKAFLIAREEIILFAFVTLMLLYLAAVGIYYFENEAQPDKFASVFHSFWWAVSTLSTVGYGDIYPITLGGRMFTFLVLMLGLGIVAVPAALLASALSKVRQDEKESRLD